MKTSHPSSQYHPSALSFSVLDGENRFRKIRRAARARARNNRHRAALACRSHYEGCSDGERKGEIRGECRKKELRPAVADGSQVQGKKIPMNPSCSSSDFSCRRRRPRNRVASERHLWWRSFSAYRSGQWITQEDVGTYGASSGGRRVYPAGATRIHRGAPLL